MYVRGYVQYVCKRLMYLLIYFNHKGIQRINFFILNKQQTEYSFVEQSGIIKTRNNKQNIALLNSRNH
jgi:uncharacterized protein YlbG (UPF0298 family)